MDLKLGAAHVFHVTGQPNRNPDRLPLQRVADIAIRQFSKPGGLAPQGVTVNSQLLCGEVDIESTLKKHIDRRQRTASTPLPMFRLTKSVAT